MALDWVWLFSMRAKHLKFFLSFYADWLTEEVAGHLVIWCHGEIFDDVDKAKKWPAFSRTNCADPPHKTLVGRIRHRTMRSPGILAWSVRSHFL